MKTKKQLKIDLVTCKDEKWLIEAWTNPTNQEACKRSLKYLNDLIANIEDDLEKGNYTKDNNWDSE